MKVLFRSSIFALFFLLTVACGQDASNDLTDSHFNRSSSNQQHSTSSDELAVQVTFSCDGTSFSSFDSTLINDPAGTGLQLWGVGSTSISRVCNTSRSLDFDASIFRRDLATQKTLELRSSESGVRPTVYTSLCTADIPMKILPGARYSCNGTLEGRTFEIKVEVQP